MVYSSILPVHPVVRHVALAVVLLQALAACGGGSGSASPSVPIAQSGIVVTVQNRPVAGQFLAVIPAGVTPEFRIVRNGEMGVAEVTDPLAGEFIYQPNADIVGGDSFTFRVNDSNEASITVMIVENLAPVLTSIPGGDPAIVADNPLAFTVSASDDPRWSLPAISASGLPGDAAFEAASVDQDAGIVTFSFSWTPTAADVAGSPHAVTFTAIDGVDPDLTSSLTVTISVTPNQAPVLATIGDRAVAAGDLLTFVVSASDLDGPAPLTLSVSGLPGGAGFDDEGDGAGTFSWIPTGADVGASPHAVTFTATDGAGNSGSETINISVSPQNQPPVLDPIGDRTVTAENPLTFSVSASDPDGPAPLTLSASGLPSGSSFIDNGNGNGTFAWTPTGADVGASPHEVTFIATDGGGLTDSVTIDITVEPNQAPILASIGDQTVTAENPLSFTISASDPDGPAPLTLSASGLPSGSSFIDNGNGNGTFAWTPTGADVGASPHEVTFIATDGGGLTDSVTIDITVEPNQAPILASIGDQTVTAENPLTFTISASDPDGPPPLTLTHSALPTGASFTDHEDGTGTFNWTPTISQIAGGPYEITFIATDGNVPGLTDDETISVHVSIADNFSGGAGNWTMVDDVPSPSSSWSVVNGVLRQQNKVESVNSFDGSYHRGAYAYYTNGAGLTDYRFSVDATYLATLQANDIGVMFRYQDNNNYYRLSMNARYGFTRLEKKVGGVFTPLAVNARGYVPGELIRFNVEANGSRIQVWINGDPMFAVTDASLGSGTVALYTQDQSSFDNVVIESPTAAPLVTLATPLAHTVSTTDTLSASAVATQVPAGGVVEFLLNGTRSVIDGTAPYSAIFDLVAGGDHTVEAIVRDAANVELARDTNIMVGAQGEYLVSLGDSITNGIGDRFSADNLSQSGRVVAVQGYQANLADLLDGSLQRPAIVFNSGIGGDRTANALTRVDSILARHPGSNRALVLLGTNDALAGTVPSGSGCSGGACNGTFKGNLQSLINTLNGAGKDVQVARIPPVFGSNASATPYANPLGATPNTTIQGYNDVINTELSGLVAGPDLFPYFLGASVNRFSLYTDPLHPNALGYVVIAHLWHNTLNPGAPVALPFILEDLGRSTVAPYLKQNLLEVGDAYYVDRSFVLTAIPSLLNGGIWLQTANNDAGSTAANYVSFEVDRPVTVYIAYDAGATARPNWMSAYTDTGQTLGTDDPLSPSLQLYSLAYNAGTITLGGNSATGASGADSHYVAIVVPD